MSGPVRLWCLRHAESHNVTEGIAGAASMAPLTTYGRHQAIAAPPYRGSSPRSASIHSIVSRSAASSRAASRY
jgi:alpha-ribazole phosphatase/probable phosphoglycerate mutase